MAAAILTVATFAGRLALAGWVGDRPVLVIFLIPIILSAYVGGLGPGLCSTMIAALGVDYFLVPPVGTFAFARSVDFAQWLVLIAAGVLVSLLSESLHRARQAAESSWLPAGTARTERKVRAGFAAALALLVSMAAVSYVSVARLTQHGADVRRAEQLIDELHSLLSATTDAETGQRGYVITGDEDYLRPFQRAQGEMPAQLARLRETIGNDPALLKDFDLLEDLVRARLQRAAETVELRRTQGFAAAQARIAEGRGRELQDSIRARIAAVEKTLDDRLLERERTVERSARLATTVIVAGGLLALAVVTVAIFVVGQDFAGSRRADAALREVQAGLERRVEARTAELAHANIALAESEGRLKLFVEHAPAALAMFDREMRYLTASRRWRDDYGLGDRELAGASHYEIFPEIGEAWKEVHRRALAGAVVRSDSDPFVRANGTTQWLRWEVRPWFDARGAIGGIVVFSEDITASHDTAATNARLAAIVESSDDAIIGKAIDGVIESWNRGAERVFGYTAAEAVGRPITMLIPPDRQDEEPELLARIVRGETVEHFETERLRKDGSRIAVAVTISPVHDATGRIVGGSKIARDITARKRAEAALRDSEARIKAIVENLTEGLVVADMDGMLLHWNAAARRMHGLADEDEARARLQDFSATFELRTRGGQVIPVEAWPIVRILRGEVLRDFEVMFRVAGSKEDRIFSYSGSVVTPAGGRSLAYVAIVDVTERRHVEAARERERRRVVLLAEISRRLVVAEAPREVLLEGIFAELAGELQVDVFANYLTVGETGRLRLESSGGLTADQIETFREIAPGESLSGLVAERRQALVLSDLPASSLPNAAGVIALGVRAYAGYPLIAGGRLIGTVSFGAKGRGSYNEEDLRLMAAVADQVSAATERARLLLELRGSEQRYRTLYDTMVQGVVYHDAAGNVIAMNPAAKRILGLGEEELVGHTSAAVQDRTIREDGSPFPGPEHPAMVALREGRPVRDVVMGCFNAREGRHRWININAVPQFSAGEARPAGVYAMFDDITERKAAENALRESEARFSTAFRASPVPIAISRRRDRVILEVNDAFLQLFECAREEIVGRTLIELNLLDPAAAALIRTQLDATGTLHDLELAVRTRGGAERQVHLAVQVMHLGGEPCALSIMIDVTDRKRAEEALRFHEAILRETGRIAKVGGWSIEVATGAGYWTEEVARIHDLGLEVQPTKEMGLTYYADESRPRIAAAVQAAVERGESYDLELQLVSALGRRKWVRTIGHPVREDGRIVRLRGSFQDITERKKAEHRLATQAAVSRVLAEAATLGEAAPRILEALCVSEGWQFGAIWAVDAAAQQLHCIDTWREPGLGTGSDALVRRTRELTFAAGEGLPGRVWQSQRLGLIPDVARDDGYPRAVFALAAGLRSALAFPILVDGGVTGVIDVLAREIRETDERLEEMFDLIGRQIGLFMQRRRAEADVRELNAKLEERVSQRTAELEAANQELEAFSYSVSHDLRAPLRAVDGFAQALSEDFGPQLPAQGTRYVKLIQEGARRMGELIDDLLTLSRLSRQPLTVRPVATKQLVSLVWADLAPERVGRELVFEVDDLPDCVADERLLRQVWFNLLSNAVKYTARRAPARIEVGAERREGATVFFVRDNGAGFDMRYAHKLFGVFQRLHRADEYVGTGVGLAIVQRMVHRHGGRVWAEAAVDRGATFFFSLNPNA